jgi:hypothetical protein
MLEIMCSVQGGLCTDLLLNSALVAAEKELAAWEDAYIQHSELVSVIPAVPVPDNSSGNT